MSNTPWTPGPWWVAAGNRIWAKGNQNPTRLGDMYELHNALIAALAPEMAEAILAWSDWMGNGLEGHEAEDVPLFDLADKLRKIGEFNG